jgi:hypothetical protein
MEKLAPILAAQYGQARFDQLAAAGVGEASTRAMLQGGAWTTPYKKVVRLAGSPWSPEQELLAVCLAHGPGAAVCDRSACWLWDMPGRHSWDEPLHVLCADNAKVRLPNVQTHRTRLLVPADVTTRRGIPVVSYARAIVDNSARKDLSNRHVGFMIDHGVRWDHLDIEQLRHTAARLAWPAPGRSTRRMNLLLADRPLGYNPGASQPEAHWARCVESAGFGKPTMNVKVRLNGITWEIDFALVRLRLGWEYQSKLFHGEASVEARKRDAEKRAALEAAGWHLDDITEDDTEATVIERASAMYAKATNAQ